MQKESSTALCDESFTELEHWGQRIHTLSLPTRTHRYEHTDPTSKRVTDIHANVCTRTRGHTHTQSRLPEDTSVPRTSPGQQGREAEGSSLPCRGPSGAHLVCDAPGGHIRENVFQPPSPDSAEWRLLEELIGPARCGRPQPKLERGSASPAV